MRRPAEPWRGQSKEQRTGTLCPVPQTEGSDESPDGQGLAGRLLEIDGGHPVALTNRQEDRLDGLHPEMGHVHKRLRVERSMTGLQDPEVFNTIKSRL